MSTDNPWLGAIALLLAAPAIGSFLGVVILRLPEHGAILWSRSRCETCSTSLAARDLVPLLSWVMARGRCRHCGAPVGWFYPAVEIAALLVAIIALAAEGMPRAVLGSLFGWWLLALGWIDIRRWLLPDILTLPLITLGLVVAMVFAPGALLDRLLGAVLGYAVLRAVASAYRAWKGFEGLGRGDAKLLAAAGAWTGASALPVVIAGAAIMALSACGVFYLSGMRLHRYSALPFGPFLSAATWLVWLAPATH